MFPIVPRFPWEIITLDFVSGLPEDSSTKYSQILIIVDKFTKYVILEPCVKEVSATQTADILVKRVVRDFGVPRLVISDRGPQFAATVWKLALNSLGAKVALATTHHPQTDGQSERVIQTLSRLLRSFVRTSTTSWTTMLPLLQFALNNASSSSTRYSPFQLVQGRNPVCPAKLLLDKDVDLPGAMELGGDRKVINWAKEWWKMRRRLGKVVRTNLTKAAQLTKKRYDSKHKPFRGEVGDLVLLSVKSHQAFEGVRKLRLRFTGPYPITAKIHDNAFQLDGLPPQVPATQNVTFLRLFKPTPVRFNSRPEPGQAISPISVGNYLEWEVESITSHRITNGSMQYKIKWRDFEQETWLRMHQLSNCKDMLIEYHKKKGLQIPEFPHSDSDSLNDDEDTEEANDASDDYERPELISQEQSSSDQIIPNHEVRNAKDSSQRTPSPRRSQRLRTQRPLKKLQR